jgi:hypothetical protein
MPRRSWDWAGSQDVQPPQDDRYRRSSKRSGTGDSRRMIRTHSIGRWDSANNDARVFHLGQTCRRRQRGSDEWPELRGRGFLSVRAPDSQSHFVQARRALIDNPDRPLFGHR